VPQTFLLESNLAANSTNDLMVDADTGESDLRFIGRPSRVTLAIDASAVGVELEISLSGRVVVPRSTLAAGGTTGVFPNVDQIGFGFFAAAGDILKVTLREVAGTATTDVMGSLSIVPIR